MSRRLIIYPLAIVVLLPAITLAWDYEGHRIVNELAIASLPPDFPAFVRTPGAIERVAFLAGEADRWRNTPDLPLKHCQEPEHYIDLEELSMYGLKPEALPVFRYDFVAAIALARKAHPDAAAGGESSSDIAHVHGLVGLLPWAITENYGKIKSSFSYLSAFQEGGGTEDEIANAQANILYVMGVMGHYVGDAAQPLHTTIYHHGWKGENPHGFTTKSSFHSWIDGGFFEKTGGANIKELKSKLRPARLVQIGDRAAKPEEMFQAVMEYIAASHKQLEPLYQLEKDGKLSGDGEVGMQGKAFLEARLLAAGQMLGDLWFSAWQQAPPDSYLKSRLARRSPSPKAGADAPKAEQKP